LSLHGFGAQLGQNILVGLFQDWQILELEVTEIIWGGGFAETTTSAISDMRWDMQRHKASFDRIDLHPYT